MKTKKSRAPKPAPAAPVPFQSPITGDPFLTLDEASRLVKVSAWTLRYYITTGDLKRIKVGRRIVIRRDDLLRFMEAHTETRSGGPWPSVQKQATP